MTPLLEYQLSLPPSVVFGCGSRATIGDLARPLGNRALVVCGSRHLAAAGVIDEVRELLVRSGIEAKDVASISREPLVEDVDRAADAIRQFGVREGDFVVAIGGGSAIDLGKAAAAMAVASGSVVDYLEGVGAGKRLERPPLPVLAVPTTAGTGSEATKNAVISSFDPPFKKSLRSEQLVPRAVLIDPELTLSLPLGVTIDTGMDAVTQLIESYLSVRSQPVPRALAVEGLRRALPAILNVYACPTSRDAREDMAHAALLSGMALANSGLGLAHGVAAALGIACNVSHGRACAVMLPIAMRVNRPVRQAAMAELARAVLPHPLESDAAAADQFVDHVVELCLKLGIPTRLSALGVTRAQIPDLVARSRGNSMNGNPRSLDDAELGALLEENL